MLETDDDIIEGLRDKAELRKNQLVTETAPSLGWVSLCLIVAAKIALRKS